MSETGWSGRTMVWLRIITHVVGLNLLWTVGTLAGLVLLGAGPATAAVSPLLDDALRGRPSEHVLRDAWDGYRRQWRRANLLLLPFWPALLLLGADLLLLPSATGTVAALLTGVVVVVGAYTAVTLAFLVPVSLRYEEGLVPTWRFVLLSPLLFPLTALAVIVTVGAALLVLTTLPVLVPLVGLSLPLALTGIVVRNRLELLDRTQAEAQARADAENGSAGL